MQEPRPIGDVFADVFEGALRAFLGALEDDVARKSAVMALRERGLLAADATQACFLWFPGMKDA